MSQTHTRFDRLPVVDVSGLFSDDPDQRLADRHANSTARRVTRAFSTSPAIRSLARSKLR